ncbi:membrane protein insertase YidC [Aquisalimonas sp. 2447]|uniref:membrane protein insertase YidC n=1 Tax=Aquisalimonas sp. 2447 TaxID=2740807 RepID=UPI0014327B6D|nr:membrane protein insertase YidC [Aquisalimonas sp. 2447]QIT57051.1 membrane protein insertase YidC [Aquisalimonas sp. 2447]
METQRLLQFFALGLVLLFIWTAWEDQYGRSATEETATEERVEEAPDDAPADAPGPADPDDDAAPAEAAEADREEAAPATAAGDRMERGETIRVRTDKLDVEISTRGGDIRQVDLLQHFKTLDQEEPLRLMSDRLDALFIAQAGLVPREGDGPGPRSEFRIEGDQREFELGDDQDTVEVPLVWESDDGIRVTRYFVFNRDSYVIDVRHEVENTSDSAWDAYQYAQLRSGEIDDGTSWFIYTYTGGVVHGEEDRYDKISFSDMRSSDLSRDLRNGWGAIIQHYFVGAWIPPRDETHRYYTRSLDDNQYLLGMSSPRKSIAAGDSGTFEHQLWVGPKEQNRLAEVAEGLDLTVDYGWLTIISKPLFIALSWIHGIVGNWGWAIVILTIGIKLAFYKLSEFSYRSMGRMRKLQPRMQQLKERYGDDRQALNQAMMKMYKEEKINPLGGCLPILVQIPVFIALYWVLLESVELRHAPFILWIQDLSSRDPYFILPLLMGASMFLQQKLNPAPMDPIQQRIMMALPFVFTIFFMFFPAGLVLYWVVNNSLSIAQQWYITRQIEKGSSE